MATGLIWCKKATVRNSWNRLSNQTEDVKRSNAVLAQKENKTKNPTGNSIIAWN
jgi:hypothetical protein